MTDLLDLLAAAEHVPLGETRIRFDLGPHGMRAIECACGAKPRDEAAHARHAAHRAATGCDCGASCPHDPKDTS